MRQQAPAKALPTRRIALIVGAAAIALIVGVWLYPSDKQKVREAADAIVAAANQDTVELSRALDLYAIEDVTITVSDLPEPLVGRTAVVAAAGRTAASGNKLSFRLQGVQISVQGTNARLSAEFVATLHLGLRGISRTRSGAALFQKIDGRFRLVSAEIGAER